MIDLHLHILPEVDDGAATPQDALEMAALLQQSGVHTAAATPHFHDWTSSLLPDRHAVEVRVATLRGLLDAQGITLTLVPAGECFLTPELPDFVARGLAPTYGDAPYLLMELPARHHVAHAHHAVAQIQRHGITVLLAHAERYAFVQKSVAGLEPLLHGGIGVQVSLRSLSQRAPEVLRRTARTLLTEGIAHVLATDAHDVAGLRDALREREGAARLVGEENLALLLEENPRRILAGEPLLALDPLKASAVGARRWWPFGWLHR